MDIEYTDGQAIEGEILQLIRQASDRSSREAIAQEAYSQWPVRYHLCPERSNLLRPFDFRGLDVLELGAGMGAVSRWLAEQSKSLYVVEGTQPRFDVLSERLKGLTNWSGEVGNFQDFHTDRKFDAVCLVGVLEYSELFLKGTAGSPHLWLLKRCREFLKPGGVLIVAIENSIGLKYWNGAAEDHRATLFDGICGYPAAPTPRTFSQKELKGLMSEAGYRHVDAFYPFPDYKVPTTLVSEALFEKAPALAAELSTVEPYRDYLGQPLVKYFSDTLAAENLSRAGLLAEFSNSFLFVASTEAASVTRKQLLQRSLKENELAWHYGHARREPTQTVFFQDRRSDSILVAKTALYSQAREKAYSVEGLGTVRWSALGPEPLLTGVSVRSLLVRHAYFQDWNAFSALFERFLRWSVQRWSTSEGQLDGRALDAIFVNARLSGSEFELFDQEWRSENPISTSWFIFRNVFNLVREDEWINASAPFASLADLYLKTCATLGVTAHLEAEIAKEARLQAQTSRGSVEHHQSNLRGLFQRPLAAPLGPRDPSVEARLRHPLPFRVSRIPRALARRAKRLLGKIPSLKKKLGGVSRRLTTLKGRTLQAKNFLIPYRPRFLRSDRSGEWTALVSHFPRGLVRVRLTGARWNALVLGFRVGGKFVSQRLPESALSGVIKIDESIESLTLEGSAALTSPRLSARSLTRLEAVLRLVSFKALVQGFRTPALLRSQVALPAVQAYGAWVQEHDTLTDSDREALAHKIASLASPPLISVLMPVFNTDPRWLRAALDSVLAQVYPHWELCVADDASTDPQVRTILQEYALKDARVRLVFRPHNGHISAASNSALEIAQGPYTALLDHDDELAPHALAVMVEHLSRNPSADLVYSDEDKIDAFGRRFDPHFKPDWDPELFLSKNFVCHFSVFRTSILKKIAGFRLGSEGSQDYDLILRFLPETTSDRIHHIPQVLYHWRAIPGSVALTSNQKSYAHERAREAIRLYLQSVGDNAVVSEGFGSMHRVQYTLPEALPPISILIPTRDRRDLLERIVEGVRRQTDYPEFEVIVVDNQTTDPDTLDYFREIKQDPRVRILRYDAEFNYSAITNLAAKEAKFPLLALLNNDLRILSADWLKELVRLAIRPGVGCVGAKLLYPSGTIQHAGVVLGIGGVADHVYRHFEGQSDVAQGAVQLVTTFSAVSAACLVVKKAIFEEVGGFDAANLAVAYNDIDFCLKVREAGYRNLWTPYSVLEHAESSSRGSDQTGTKKARFEKETAWMKTRWGKYLALDPAYNPNLGLERPDGSLAFPPRWIPFYRTAPSSPAVSKPLPDRIKTLDAI